MWYSSYLGIATNEIHDKIMSSSSSACYYLVQNHMFLVSKELKIIYYFIQVQNLVPHSEVRGKTEGL